MDLSSFFNDLLNCSFDEAMKNEILNSLSLFWDEKKPRLGWKCAQIKSVFRCRIRWLISLSKTIYVYSFFSVYPKNISAILRGEGSNFFFHMEQVSKNWTNVATSYMDGPTGHKIGRIIFCNCFLIFRVALLVFYERFGLNFSDCLPTAYRSAWHPEALLDFKTNFRSKW